MIVIKTQGFRKLFMYETDNLQIVNIVYEIVGIAGFESHVGFIY